MGKDATAEGAPFVVKTYQLVSDESTNDYVTWSETEDSFVVLKPVEFASDILPRFFKHNNFCSFIRQLNTYGFHKVETKQWEFKHEFFIRGQPELLKQIARRKSKKRESSPPPDERHTQQNNLSPPPSRPSTKEPINVVTPPSSLPTPTMTPTHTNNISPPPLFSSPNLQLPSEPYQEVDEVDQLRDMNNKLIAEISRLNEQQETTQLTIKQILNELIESRKVQQNLEQKVNILARELQFKTIHDSTEPIKQDLKPRQVKQPFAFTPMQHAPVQNYPVEATPGVEFTPNPTDLDYLQVLIENPDMESALNSILAQNGYPTEVTASSSSMNGHNGKVAYVTQPY